MPNERIEAENDAHLQELLAENLMMSVESIEDEEQLELQADLNDGHDLPPPLADPSSAVEEAPYDDDNLDGMPLTSSYL